ncbi:alpha/beta-hydrolase [Xylaria cf. heliscus]|nr:alpha/beta-hydrolase [Xylaria cf. heliscus]
MAAPKPVIVIMHGAFVGPAHYIRLTGALKRAGFEVHVPDLPTGNGARPPTASLKEDTELIRSFVEKLLDSDHNGAVSHIIYMAAMALPENTSAVDKAAEMGALDLIRGAYEVAEDMSIVSRSPREELLGDWDNEAEADWYTSSLKVWNGNAMYERIERCAWREMPVTYVHTAKDNSIPLAAQESMVERLRAEGADVKTVTLETGHSPHFTMASEVADIISRVAGQGHVG